MATIFVLYMTIREPEPKVWNGLFWVIQLFICINAVAKSFLQETRGRMLYFYSIVNPRDFILAKLVFNSVLMLLMSFLSILLFSLFLGNPVQKVLPFIGLVLLGGWSLSLVFTFLAAIAAKAQQNAAIMAQSAEGQTPAAAADQNPPAAPPALEYPVRPAGEAPPP